MDILTLSLATKKALETLGVKNEPGKVLLEAQLAEGTADIVNGINLVEGQEYNVCMIDRGVKQDLGKTIAKKIVMEEGYLVYIGNIGLMEGNYEGGVYLAADIYSNGVRAMSQIVVASPSNATFVIEQTETIVPIDQKYLPGVCLPVVELSTEPAEEPALLTAEESAMMDKVAAMGMPIIVSYLTHGITTKAVFVYMAQDDMMMYINKNEATGMLAQLLKDSNNLWGFALLGEW